MKIKKKKKLQIPPKKRKLQKKKLQKNCKKKIAKKNYKKKKLQKKKFQKKNCKKQIALPLKNIKHCRRKQNCKNK